jgi:integrase
VGLPQHRHRWRRQDSETRRSVRAITLAPTLAAELEAWWKESTRLGDDDYVFASSHGTRLDGRNMVRQVFEPARLFDQAYSDVQAQLEQAGRRRKTASRLQAVGVQTLPPRSALPRPSQTKAKAAA